MDYTKNQIYKYAKYLDKYTKNSNKDGSVYLQKLNKYSHNAQHGGAGELEAVVKQIQESVTQVIDTDTRTMTDLTETINRFTGIIVTVQDYQEKFTLTSKKQEEIADLACQIAGITRDNCKKAVMDGGVDGKDYVKYWTIESLYGDLIAIPYFQSNFLNCIKIIKALLQMKLIALMLTTDEIKDKDTIIATCIDELKSLEAIIQYLLPIDNINALFTTRNIPDNLTLEEVRKIVEKRKVSIAPEQSPEQSPAPAPEQPPGPVQQPISVQSAPVQSPAPISPLDSVTTDKFDVFGYYTDDMGKATRYTFKTTGDGQNKVLNEGDVPNMIETLLNGKLKSMLPQITVVTKQSFKPNKNNTTFRIVLIGEVPIRTFAQLFFAKPIKIQVDKKQVRLYVRPVTYPPPSSGQLAEKELQINELGTEIDTKIKENDGVSTQPSKQYATTSSPITVRPASAQVKFDPANPTTNKFDIIGFTIRDGRQTSYAIPPNQKEKVLDLLPEHLKGQRNKKQPIELIDKNTHARVTFSTPLSIGGTLNEVNNYESPKKVYFTTSSGNPLTVYLFIVPMTYPITDETNPENKEYYEAINLINEGVMEKINEAMTVQAEQRNKVQLESAQRRQVPASTSTSTPTTASLQQPPASAPLRRGRGGQAGGSKSLSTRGPYHHPNKEYHL